MLLKYIYNYNVIIDVGIFITLHNYSLILLSISLYGALDIYDLLTSCYKILPLNFYSFFFFFFFVFLRFLGPLPGHMEVPMLGVKLEL